jgi:hypothetical protein
MTTTWHGTQLEHTDLLKAIARNCTCTSGEDGPNITCQLCRAVEADQRFVDGLVFARRNASRFRAGEFLLQFDTARMANYGGGDPT